jgi:DNA-binding response OmpR family regulator
MVLVVDDDLNLQTLLHVLLSRAGFSVDFATDGPAGLQKMQDKDYEAILLDLLVPSRTGLQLLESLSDTRPELVNRVVVVSGAQPATLDKARAFPVHAVIRKPFDIFELLDTVRTCSAVVCK